MQGNLTMSWNGSGWLAALMRTGRWAQAVRQARALDPNASIVATLRTLIGRGVLPLLPTPLSQALRWLRHPSLRQAQPWLARSAIHPDFAAAHRVDERARTDHFMVRYDITRDTRRLRYEALAQQEFGAYLSAYRAMYGVDMRTPPADLRLAEFCLALPEEQYARDGETRRLVRCAMAQRLPEAVLVNRRRGFQAADWFERLSAARPQMQAELARLERCELAHRALDLRRLQRMSDDWPSGTSKDYAAIAPYLTVFQTGLMTGRFLAWFENGTQALSESTI